MQILLSMLATCINDPEYVHVYHPVGKAWQCMYRANHNYGCFENKRVHECMSLELTLFLVYIILHVLHVGTSLCIICCSKLSQGNGRGPGGATCPQKSARALDIYIHTYKTHTAGLYIPANIPL